MNLNAMSKRTRLIHAAICVTLSVFAAIAHADEPTPQHVPITTAETMIVPGCVLAIAVEGEIELSHTYAVDNKGLIYFTISDSSGIDRERWSVVVRGKNTNEATTAVTASLERFFKKPHVGVTIVRVPGMHVEISGEVLRPGPYVLPFNARVSDLFDAAPTRRMADLTNVLIRRIDRQSKPQGGVKSFNIDFTASSADESDDPKLEDGDKVYIRKSAQVPVAVELRIVRVVGEINGSAQAVAAAAAAPRSEGLAIPITGEMKLKDLFAQLGGLKASADRAHIYLGRQDGTTRVLDADGIERDDPDQNLKLIAGDLVIVPLRDRSQVFAVLGEVNAPNTFEFKAGEKVKVLDAIARAGDLSRRADPHRALLSRGYLLDPTKARQIPFDPDLVRKGAQPNMDLDPGDAVFIEVRKRRPTIWQQLLPLALHFLPF